MNDGGIIETNEAVTVECESGRVVVSLGGAGFRGTSRSVLLLALAMPWLIVGPAFALLIGGAVASWVVIVAAIVSGLIGFGLSFVAILLATRTHHFSVEEGEVRFWTDAIMGSVSREWSREVVVGLEVVEGERGRAIEVVATNGDRLRLPLVRSAEELGEFADSVNEALRSGSGD